MQWLIKSLLVLAICEPQFLDSKKVVVMMPRHQRRSHSTPWRQLRHFKKNGFPYHGFPGQKYGFSQSPQLYRPKELYFAKDQYPQGGDDFDQGYEEVNHVMVPHGKGISHAVSFGKGYIPFDSYKDHRPSASYHHNYEVEHPSGPASVRHPTMVFSSGPSYSQAFLSQQADSYIGNEDKNEQDELQDRIHDRAAQNFATGKSLHDTTSSPSVGTNFGAQDLSGKPSGGVFTPSGIPSATIGGSVHGIVVSDSIAFDDYNRQVEALTKSWPANFINSNNLIPGSVGNTRQGTLQQLHEFSRQFDGSGFSGGTNFASSLGKRQQGYEVKEDVVDTPPDFRTMPIQTAPAAQSPQQHIQYIHRPFQQSMQHIFSSPQGLPKIPLDYGIPNNFQRFLHG